MMFRGIAAGLPPELRWSDDLLPSGRGARRTPLKQQKGFFQVSQLQLRLVISCFSPNAFGQLSGVSVCVGGGVSLRRPSS